MQPSKTDKVLDVETWDALKAAGVTEDELLEDQPFGPLVYSYTRKQAIADGVLVDLGATGGKRMMDQAGFMVPVAMTDGAFKKTILSGTTYSKAGVLTFPPSQSARGRLWDVLMVMRHAIFAANARGDTDRVDFKVDVDTNGDGKHETVKLWSLIGPGDDAEAVMTIMLEGED